MAVYKLNRRIAIWNINSRRSAWIQLATWCLSWLCIAGSGSSASDPFALRTSGNISGVRRKRSIERAYRAVLSIVFTTLLTQHGSGATKVQRKIAYGKVAAAWSISVYQSRHTDETRSYRSAYRPLACNHSIAYRWFSGWLCDVEESHRELGRDVAYHSK